MRGVDYRESVNILTGVSESVGVKETSIDKIYGRIIACDITATESVPHFPRSPYDGYAFVASDTGHIGQEADHVRLRIIDSIRAGQVSKVKVTGGTCVKLMTGSMIPEGADCVCKFEDTVQTDKEIVINRSFSHGENVICAGEDIKKGDVIVRSGTEADTGIVGMLASLGIKKVKVYKRLKAGIITTGDEIADIDKTPDKGMIRNSNRYIIESALRKLNIKPYYIGHASDHIRSIRRLIGEAGKKSDVIISTGGVSVGDYDLVAKSMSKEGFEILCDAVAIKPGMACAYGIRRGKIMMALSGNPASALTNLQCVCAPALRRMAGYSEFENVYTDMYMNSGFENKGGMLRLLRGRVVLENGRAVFVHPFAQGNGVVSSIAQTNAYVLIDPHQSVAKGDMVKGFLI